MSCPVCNKIMEFVFKDGEGEFVCPSCKHKHKVEHVEVKL